MIAKPGAFPAKVAKVIDDYKLVINRGREHGIREGQRVLVYKVDDEQIVDPDTGESLGSLELVKGTGKVFYVEDKYSLVESNMLFSEEQINGQKTFEERIKTLQGNISVLSILRKGTLKAFDNPQVGDFVKLI